MRKNSYFINETIIITLKFDFTIDLTNIYTLKPQYNEVTNQKNRIEKI